MGYVLYEFLDIYLSLFYIVSNELIVSGNKFSINFIQLIFMIYCYVMTFIHNHQGLQLFQYPVINDIIFMINGLKWRMYWHKFTSCDRESLQKTCSFAFGVLLVWECGYNGSKLELTRVSKITYLFHLFQQTNTCFGIVVSLHTSMVDFTDIKMSPKLIRNQNSYRNLDGNILNPVLETEKWFLIPTISII